MAAVAATTVLAGAEEITDRTVWQGAVTIAETVRITSRGHLTVLPDTRVSFTGHGRIVCNGGSFQATGAVFEAEQALDAPSRIAFESARVAVFRDCVLRGLIATGGNQIAAAVRAVYTPLRLEGCRVTASSPVLVLHATGPVITASLFEAPQKEGLVAWCCDRTRVEGNTFRAGPATVSQLYLKKAENSVVVANRFFGHGRDMALLLRYGAAGNRVLANSFFRCGTGIRIQGHDVARNLFIGNLVYRPRVGILIRDGCGGENVVANSVVWGAGGSALSVGAGAGTGSLCLRNCVLAAGRVAASLGAGAVMPTFVSNCVWDNEYEPGAEIAGAIRAGGVLAADPLFVDPAGGNFRPQLLATGYVGNSPLLGAGTPAGTSIGLFPVLGPAPDE